MGNLPKILLAYVLGQATQLILHGVCVSTSIWLNRHIPFCAAGGGMVLIAVICLVALASDNERNPDPETTYMDRQHIPMESIKDEEDAFFELFKK